LGLLGVGGGKFGQDLVDGEQVLARFRRGHQFGGIEVAPGEAASAVPAALAARVRDEDAAHGFGIAAKKMM
jgi:hypothetical protein